MMRVSIVAAESTRRVVNVAASISLGAKASRQRIELAAKQSMAVAAKPTVREKCCFDIDNRTSAPTHANADGAAALLRMCSASRAASFPTPFRNDEFILHSQGRPKK